MTLQLSINAFDYNCHVDLIKLLRQEGKLYRLRKARQKMSELFPLTEGVSPIYFLRVSLRFLYICTSRVCKMAFVYDRCIVHQHSVFGRFLGSYLFVIQITTNNKIKNKRQTHLVM